ncbi:MAG: L,D-transpeptidase family protein [Desulfuromonadaceae bacterium]|nr:L,D-transpeptidase family protein [Desulfuromonadaceae bacterium]MDD2855851.1 L,D-transpeptidase family protein [Desulfuromonadaceae bacterium]
MKFWVKQHICTAIIIFTTVLFFAFRATADVKQDAESTHLSLHRNSYSENYPDDMKSLDLAIEIAERYFVVGEKESADRFYLLALQKAFIIESMLKKNEEESGETENEPNTAGTTGEETVDFETDSPRFVGRRGVYRVVKGDTLSLVAAKLGVSQLQLRSMNHLTEGSRLRIGQKLRYNNLRIVPQLLKNGIVINIPDRTLYYFQSGTLVTSLPVALGSIKKSEKYFWQTPIGKFRVTGKIKDPTWTVPTSIQSEMEENGKEILTSVSPGPKNPLGRYAIKTSIPGILIHSTTKPASIYSFSSHGCIRLSPDQMETFFPKLKVNTLGEIIYKPIKLAVNTNGRVFLEVHRDFYKKRGDLLGEAREMIEKQNLSDLIDWEKFKTVVREKSGIAEDISL